jgi:multiple sugar transport system substrate-binding protein
MFKHFVSLFILSVLIPIATAFSGTITINSMHSDPTAKKSFNAVIQAFEKENPDIKVKINTTSHESYKIQIRTWLPNQAPDIATWFAGSRAQFFIEKGLVEPIDDIWKDIEGDFPAGIIEAVSYKGKRYLLPTSYYHWGVYYRKDLFAKAGIQEAPQTWKELLEASEKLKKIKVTPFTIGTKNAWPAAAWFDFMNMRVNGFKFHMDVMKGKIKYTDERIKNAMKKWAELINIGAFNKSHPSLTWQEAMALMWQDKAAMYLMGNFISTEIPSKLKGKVGFFRFPKVRPSDKLSELAPTDVYFIPSKAKNKVDAKKFIRFLAKAKSQETINGITQLIPPNKKAKVDKNNFFLTEGVKILADADGISQFYDRDAHPEIAKAGMDGFVEFMIFPDRLDGILKNIDRIRKRIEKKAKRALKK